MPLMAPRTAESISESANTMFGLLPPNSSVTRFRVSAAVRMISLPTEVEPVNATLSIPGCATTARPVAGPPVNIARFEDRLALVERLQHGQLIYVLFHQIRYFPYQPTTLAG